MGNQTSSQGAEDGRPDRSDDYAHFRIVDEIARGGMGVVLKGHDVDMGRDVAIKILLGELGENPLAVQRFVEEAQIIGQLQHPGIVPIYELGVTAQERPYFAMQLVKGKTLAEELSTRSPSDFSSRLLSIFESVAQTMAYAHSRRVIHRDLKPSNVMIGSFGEVLLVDWGLAKVLSPRPAPEIRSGGSSTDNSAIETVRSRPDGESQHSTTGSVLGTLAYMSPEQARGEVEDLDERTDVFSLGAILCEILTGRTPYPHDRGRAVSMPRSGDVSSALDALEKCHADAALVALAKDCLEPARADRPADAGHVAERVGAWLASVEERAQGARIEAAEALAREAGERRARWLTIGLAVSLLFAVLLIAGSRARTQAERAKRMRQTEEGVAEHLSAASFARGRAEWNEAQLAVAQARARVGSGIAGEELLARIEAEERAIEDDSRAERERLQQIERRRRFAREVELLRSRVTRTNRAKLASYARIMGEFGVEMGAADDRVEDAIRASDLVLEMARVLTDWARLQRLVDPRQVDEVTRLLQLALAIDHDPRRSELRLAILHEDRDAILRIAREETLPDPMAVIVLADELWILGEREEALRVLTQAELDYPGDFHLHAKLAARYMNLSDTSGALVHLKAALVREPQNPWLLASLGLMHRLRGETERAVAVCRRAVAADPEDAYAAHYLGVALAANGDAEGAIESYRKAVELDPEYVFALRRLAYALSDVGEHRESLELLERAAELEPERVFALNSVAWRLATLPDVSLRDPVRALALAERVIAREPDDPNYLRTYGACLYYNGRFEDSIAANERALALSEGLDRSRAEIFFLAMAHARLDHMPQARTWLARGEALVADPETASAEMLRLRDEARTVVESW